MNQSFVTTAWCVPPAPSRRRRTRAGWLRRANRTDPLIIDQLSEVFIHHTIRHAMPDDVSVPPKPQYPGCN
eukprot:COSAG02_NODE_5266_length_4485_cov_2.297538_3_plen_71_part_00